MEFKSVNSLAALKRFLQVGQKWKCSMYENGSLLVWDAGEREIAIKDTVKIGFKMSDGRTSYLGYPKASDLRLVHKENGFSSNGFHIMIPECNRHLVYLLAE